MELEPFVLLVELILILPLFILARFISRTAWKLCVDELLSWLLMETIDAVAAATFLSGNIDFFVFFFLGTGSDLDHFGSTVSFLFGTFNDLV